MYNIEHHDLLLFIMHGYKMEVAAVNWTRQYCRSALISLVAVVFITRIKEL